jgi:hypothetical protein
VASSRSSLEPGGRDSGAASAMLGHDLGMRRRSDQHGGLPIKLGPASNGEFVPPHASPVVREAIRRSNDEAEVVARCLGISRRRFLASLGGSPLAPEVKAGTLGHNAARLHGIEPVHRDCAFSRAELRQVHADLALPTMTLGPATADEVARAIAAHLVWAVVCRGSWCVSGGRAPRGNRHSRGRRCRPRRGR